MLRIIFELLGLLYVVVFLIWMLFNVTVDLWGYVPGVIALILATGVLVSNIIEGLTKDIKKPSATDNPSDSVKDEQDTLSG